MTTATEKDPIDIHVGGRVKAIRLERGKSQAELAAAIGVTFQQVQKYEKGLNRISASTLHKVAGYLDCGVGQLFPPRGRAADSEPGSAETWAAEKVQAFLGKCDAHAVFQVLATKAPGLLILSMMDTGRKSIEGQLDEVFAS